MRVGGKCRWGLFVGVHSALREPATGSDHTGEKGESKVG